jgi:hypothetical protein
MAVESVRYWWFERRSAVALAWRIFRAVLTGRFARLEVIRYDGERGECVKFRVVRKGDDALRTAGLSTNAPDDINDAWPCPIFCPGGGGGA